MLESFVNHRSGGCRGVWDPMYYGKIRATLLYSDLESDEHLSAFPLTSLKECDNVWIKEAHQRRGNLGSLMDLLITEEPAVKSHS